MSCRIVNILPRDGTNQLDRKQAALGFDYVPIEERGPKEWLEYARELSTEINFFGLNNANSPNGTWENFFTVNIDDFETWFEQSIDKQNLPAHLTLFITFLKLLEYLKDDVNGLTKRHLDFYYREILGFRPKPAVPDQVHVLVDLAKTVEAHRLEAGILVKAGKDDTGKDLVYTLNRETVFNETQVASIKTVFRDEAYQSRIYAASVANSTDGQGKNAGKPDVKWATFGERQNNRLPDKKTMVEAEIGLAITDPVLLLKEGKRQVTLGILYSGTLNGTDLTDAFSIWASGEKEWINLGVNTPRRSATSSVSGIIYLDVAIDESVAPIVAYNRAKLGDAIDTKFPVFKILLNNNSNQNFKYENFKNLKILLTGITVNVEGVRDVVLQNDNGTLNPNGKFYPFGAQPSVGSSFYIGSQEVFSKNINSLKINFEWLGAPNDFKSHYDRYDDNNSLPTNTAYQAETAYLRNGKWVDKNSISLFSPSPTQKKYTINFGAIPGATPSGDNARYDANTKNGFIRLNLNPNDFQHAVFPGKFAKSVIAGDPINPPYTPEMKSLSLDYIGSSLLSWTPNNTEGKLFYITPFGSTPIQHGVHETLLPQIAQGTLYIGLKNVQPPQNVSLLFQVLEGSGDPDIDITKDDIQWSLLETTGWRPFDSGEIIEDSTAGLQNSGIISFTIGEKASLVHQELPADMIWIKAELSQNPAGTVRMLAIHAQAAIATWLDRENAPAHLATPLAAEIIAKLEESQAPVKKLQQPFESFGGRMQESEEHFYIRVSERLRHKQRGVTLWDVEHLVLEAFPEIFKVKCINHYLVDDEGQDKELVPGHTTVIVIPNLRNKNAIDPLKPRVGNTLRTQIKTYLEAHMSTFIALKVLNPIYEEIKLDFQVGLHSGYDPQYYARQLNEEIIRFLSPWAFEEGEDIVFGGRIYKSILIDFIEERPYVDFVTGFKLQHFRRGISYECIAATFVVGAVVKGGVAEATTPRSILISAAQHNVHVLAPGEAPCTSSAVPTLGIGTMTVKKNFIIR